MKKEKKGMKLEHWVWVWDIEYEKNIIKYRIGFPDIHHKHAHVAVPASCAPSDETLEWAVETEHLCSQTILNVLGLDLAYRLRNTALLRYNYWVTKSKSMTIMLGAKTQEKS